MCFTIQSVHFKYVIWNTLEQLSSCFFANCCQRVSNPRDPNTTLRRWLDTPIISWEYDDWCLGKCISRALFTFKSAYWSWYLFSNSLWMVLAGISVVVVFGMVLWSILSLLFRFGNGLPEGPFGILGLTQSLSFVTWHDMSNEQRAPGCLVYIDVYRVLYYPVI